MRYRLLFRPQAEQELLEARDWYEAHKPGLGEAFLAAIDAILERIEERPLAYPCVHGEIRRAVLRRFPYAVFFRVIDDDILVLGVLHGARHPQSWRSRS